MFTLRRLAAGMLAAALVLPVGADVTVDSATAVVLRDISHPSGPPTTVDMGSAHR